MSDEHTPDRPLLLATGGPSPRIIDTIEYLGAISLFLATICVFVAYVTSDSTLERLVLVLGTVVGALGFLCWSLNHLLRYRRPQRFSTTSAVANSASIRRGQTFIAAWTCFVGAAAFGALAVLIATQGFSGLTASILPIGALIVFVLLGAPVWIVSRRLRRQIQGAG